MSYLNRRNYTIPKQTEALSDLQKENNAGGYSYVIDNWTQLKRFLILGTEKGTYYCKEEDITKQNIDTVRACITEDGTRVVNEIYDIARKGRAPKRDVYIYVLALSFTFGDKDTKRAVHNTFTEIINTGTDLFTFVSFIDDMRGWGRSLRTLVSSWYINKASTNNLDYQLVKYQQRKGWSHQDVLRKCHLSSTIISNTSSLRWVVNQTLDQREVTRKNSDKTFNYEKTGELPELITAFEEVKKTDKESTIIRLIEKHRLTHEMVPNQWKSSLDVWNALLQNMPVTALIRNLNKMTSIGLIKEFSDATSTVIDKLCDEAILKSRVHPLQLLVAVLTYASGEGVQGNLTWRPVNTIVDILEDKFYVSFNNIVPTNKNTLLALDISSSMTYGNISGSPHITPAIGASAMALVTAKSEKNYQIVGFNHEMTHLHISARDTLESAFKKAQVWSGGGTDCAAPILYAIKNELSIDTFVVYTDNETWCGRIHPKQAFDQYRQRLNKPDAKFVVVGMEANEFSIADPTDPGMLDLVGFDTASPNLISSFARGELS